MLDLKAKGVSSTCELWLLSHQVNQHYYGDVMMVKGYEPRGALSHPRGHSRPVIATSGMEPSNAQRKEESPGLGAYL